MAAARQLAVARPGDRIVLLEANRAAEGASARNSGFLVDATLNEGTGTASDIETFRRKYELSLAAIEEVRSLVERYGIECDWDPCGKLYGARHTRYRQRLQTFSGLLSKLGMEHEILDGEALKRHTGTDFYTTAVWTKTSVILHPGKLARGILDSLPAQIELFEKSPVIAWQKTATGHLLQTPGGTLSAKKVIFAINGFMPELGVEKSRNFALLLTASLSRPLTTEEHRSIGAPKPYGLLSADAMGATIRLTRDNRVLIRNTCEVPAAVSLNPQALARRRQSHAEGLKRRFPGLDPSILTHSWSGIVCLSANGHHVFGKIADGAYVAGCYNANGLGLANLLGREIANFATGQASDIISRIEERSQPARLPPQPLLRWGARLRLLRDGIKARSEA
jgi:glycine/D-amino acid oxidase-like deaminating enzyme